MNQVSYNYDKQDFLASAEAMVDYFTKLGIKVNEPGNGACAFIPITNGKIIQKCLVWVLPNGWFKARYYIHEDLPAQEYRSVESKVFLTAKDAHKFIVERAEKVNDFFKEEA